MEGLRADVPILVVDDSPGIRAVVEAYLKRYGFTNVRTAEGIQDGLAAFHEQGSEIVFLDMVLDGDQLGVEIASKVLEERPFTVVVIMSALPRTNELIIGTIAEGARYVLAKPIRPGDVRAVLDDIADERAGEHRAESDATYA